MTSLIIEFTPFSVPNVFTPYPASPGSNDYFEIKNLPPNTGLKIWNRWGLVIFSTEDYLNDWEAAWTAGRDLLLCFNDDQKRI